MKRGKLSLSKVCIGFFIILSFNFCSYSQHEKDNTSPPDNSGSLYEVHYLPDNLREVSGIALIDSITIACIQDEKGIIFMYDLETEKIINQIEFGPDGDYEDICMVQNTLYILRSDGMLFEVGDYLKDKIDVRTYALPLASDNNEGLCYDRAQERLLIAGKNKIGKAKEVKDIRLIYGFDLKTKKPEPIPAYTINQQIIMDFALKSNIPVPLKVKKDGTKGKPVLKVHPSAIAIHPFTQKIYILSADDHFLLIFDSFGNIEHLVPLNTLLFNKAEGITFTENGDVLISNEGQTGKATIIRIEAQKTAEVFK